MIQVKVNVFYQCLHHCMHCFSHLINVNVNSPVLSAEEMRRGVHSNRLSVNLDLYLGRCQPLAEAGMSHQPGVSLAQFQAVDWAIHLVWIRQRSRVWIWLCHTAVGKTLAYNTCCVSVSSLFY